MTTLLAGQVSAAIITTPVGLAPGSTYRLIFVTSGTTTANSTNIADYNAFATAQANSVAELAALNVSWVVVGGTASVTALTNVGTSTAPVYDLASNLIGSSMPAIFAATSVQHVVNIDQLGDVVGGLVWTGTSDNCGAQNRPLGINGNGATRTGNTSETNSNWISNSNAGSGGSLPIYALSSEITIRSDVPEPATFGLAGVVLAAAFAYRRRRQQIRG
jgi:hypothetical protein